MLILQSSNFIREWLNANIWSNDKWLCFYWQVLFVLLWPTGTPVNSQKAEIQMMTAVTTCADRWKKAQLSHFQWMKVCQELYSSQQLSKGRPQPNFFHSTEIILLDEKEVCEEKQYQAEPPADALLSPLCSAQNQEIMSKEQTAYFRSAFVIIGVLGEEASASLFSKLMSCIAQTALRNQFQHATTYPQSHFKVTLMAAHTDALSLSFTFTHVSNAFPEGDFPIPKEQHCDMGESSNESIRNHGSCSTTAAWSTLPLFPGWCVKTAAPFALHSLLTACKPCSGCSLLCYPCRGMKGEGAYQNQIAHKTGKFSPSWGQLWQERDTLH